MLEFINNLTKLKNRGEVATQNIRGSLQNLPSEVSRDVQDTIEDAKALHRAGLEAVNKEYQKVERLLAGGPNEPGNAIESFQLTTMEEFKGAVDELEVYERAIRLNHLDAYQRAIQLKKETESAKIDIAKLFGQRRTDFPLSVRQMIGFTDECYREVQSALRGDRDDLAKKLEKFENANKTIKFFKNLTELENKAEVASKNINESLQNLLPEILRDVQAKVENIDISLQKNLPPEVSRDVQATIETAKGLHRAGLEALRTDYLCAKNSNEPENAIENFQPTMEELKVAVGKLEVYERAIKLKKVTQAVIEKSASYYFAMEPGHAFKGLPEGTSSFSDIISRSQENPEYSFEDLPKGLPDKAQTGINTAKGCYQNTIQTLLNSTNAENSLALFEEKKRELKAATQNIQIHGSLLIQKKRVELEIEAIEDSFRTSDDLSDNVQTKITAAKRTIEQSYENAQQDLQEGRKEDAIKERENIESIPKRLEKELGESYKNVLNTQFKDF